MNKYIAWYKTWNCLPILDFVSGWDLAYHQSYCEAAVKFERGLAKYPSHAASPDARYALAQCYKRIGDKQALRSTLRMLLRLHPDHEPAYLSLAKTEAACGAFREAARILKTTIKTFGADPEYIDLLSTYLLKSQAPQKIIDEILKQLSFSSEQLSAVPKILYELRFGTLQRGRSLLGTRFQSNDETKDERLLYATFCLEQGKTLFARQLLRELYQQNPTRPEICFRLAQSFAEDNCFVDLDAALHFSLEASKQSLYRYADALELVVSIYKQQNQELLTQLFEARLEAAKPDSCYVMCSTSRAHSSGTLSA